MTNASSKQTNYPEPLRDGDTVLQHDGELYEQLSKANIENYVGTARIPVGIAGPVLVNGDAAQGEFSIPMAYLV